jgi:hypothetical protein
MIQLIANALANPIVTTGLFTVLGGVVGFLGTFLVAAMNKRAEKQRQIRELGVKLALANLEHRIREGQKLADATGKPHEVLPLAFYIAEGIKLAEIVCNTQLNAEVMGKKLAGIEGFGKTILTHIEPGKHKAK